jgi:hypothetical protein
MKKFLILPLFLFLLVSCNVESSQQYNIQKEVATLNEKIRLNILYTNKEKLLGELELYDAEIIELIDDFSLVTVLIPSPYENALRSSKNVEFIEPDKQLEIEPTDTTIMQDELLTLSQTNIKELTGKGVKIAILDSGIATHEDLEISGGISFVDYTTDYTDDNGHGTHVAGIIGAKNNKVGIVGIAPDSKLYAVKVLDKDGIGFVSNIVSGVQWAIEQKMDIINISIGSKVSSPILKLAIDNAYKNNTIIFSSAGNYGTAVGTTNTMTFPAKYPSSIAVGAIDHLKLRASFSSTGEELELVAPGTNILSTYLKNSYVQMSGTSMATPYISGVTALLLERNPTTSAENIREILQQNAVDLGPVGRDSQYGYGLVQIPVKPKPSLFLDIEEHWANREINEVQKRGWITGIIPTIFGPDENLTRAQAAVILTRILDLPPSQNHNFNDVNYSHWAKKEINAVADYRIMLGITETSFAPEQALSREQFAVILDRVFIEKGVLSKKEQAPSPFKDVNEKRWSKDSITRIASLWIINGVSPNVFDPMGLLTRAQMATMLSRGASYLE